MQLRLSRGQNLQDEGDEFEAKDLSAIAKAVAATTLLPSMGNITSSSPTASSPMGSRGITSPSHLEAIVPVGESR